MQRIPLSIKSKITATVFLLATALMATLTIAGYRFFTKSFQEGLSRQHQATVSVAARHIDEEVADCLEQLSLLAAGLDPARLSDPVAMRGALAGQRLALTLFDGGLQLTDREGRIVAEYPAPADRTGQRIERDYVALPLNSGRPFISPPYRSSLPPHHPCVTFAVPVKTKDGKVAGVLAGRNDLLITSGVGGLTRLKLGAAGYLFMVHRNRTMVLHPNPSRIMEPVAPGTVPALDRALANWRPDFSEGTNYEGRDGVVAAIPLKNAQWVVGSYYPTSEAYTPRNRARTYFALLFALVLIPALATLWFLVRRTTGPLLNLIDHVRTLPTKAGEGRRVRLETGDELEDLAEAFNTMVAEMDQKHAVLVENQELYRIIADFTLEFALLLNADGSVRYISANCLTLTGYADREFYRDPELLARIIHPEERSAWERHACADPDKPIATLDLRIRTKSGEVRWFNHSCHRAAGLHELYPGGRGGSFRDITQTIVFEQKLDEQRQFVEEILENTSTPLFVLDREHRVLIWNRALAELTGCRAEEMLGSRRHWAPFYPEERPTLSDLVLEGRSSAVGDYYPTHGHAPTGNIVRGEGWYPFQGGRRYLVFDAAPVKRDGETIAVVETLYDLTDRALAEQSLRLFSQAVEQTASSIVITDPAGQIQYVNRKFSEMTGYSKEEALDRNPRILKSDRLPPEVYRELWATISAGREWHGEFHNKRKNGTMFWESATISPIVDGEGTITHFLAVKEDIDQRKETERKLAKKQAELVLQHEQLATLFRQVEQGKKEWEQTMDCIDDMVVLADAQRRVKRCNRAFMEFTGLTWSNDDWGGWCDLLHRVVLDVDAVGPSGEIFHQPSGRWFSLKRYPYGDQGEEVITLHDLTEIKRVTEQLAHAYDELKATHSQLLQQEKMASIGQLAAGVAHEINNPMGFISSNLSTMEKYLERLETFLALQGAGIAEAAPSEMRQELEQARKKLKVDHILEDARSLLAESRDGADRVRTIVQNLKSFSRVDEAETKYVDLNECLESTINIAWNELKYKTTLKREYGELPQVKCLPQQLNQVFLNMLVNAAHAIEKQGEVTVRTRKEGEEVRVSISDTGCGIPEEIRNRIFEPFFTTKKVGQGTGLGLSISYDIIKKHHGSIEVESTPGEGTTFVIRLPIEGGEP